MGGLAVGDPFEDAQIIEKERAHRMRKVLETRAAWPICAGTLLAGLGMALISFGVWYSLAGLFLFLGGVFLTWKDLQRASTFQEKLALEPEGVYLGRFDLNGYSFKAYERESGKNSTQLRLISFPAVTPEREAAFIRYIVNEGLVENIWPGMGKKIMEEANWAFFK